MDLYVKEVQEWLNSTYGEHDGFSIIDEDGITGNATCTALVKAMQIELGITPIDGVWGTATSNAFTPLSTDTDSSNISYKNRIYILQGGLYCKGYNPYGFNGVFGDDTASAVRQFKSDAGLSNPTERATAAVLKALLNTDAYTLLSNGDSMIRTIQQSLNSKYYSYTGLIPCDGIYAKTTCSALITGLQVEQKKEYSDTTVDGLWGPTTMSRCPTLSRYSTVSNKQYVYLLQYALYANGYDPNGFDGGFGAGVQKAVTSFQAFAGLDSDGIVGKQTWASLLVSYGDANRTCSAIDCMTPITEDTAALLVSNGKTAVGRYLTGGSDKALTIGELRIIYNAGLKLFPIYQTSGNKADYFSRRQGLVDAYQAYKSYGNLHIRNGAIVYFAVDYDATASDISNSIIPYFEGINARLNKLGNTRFGVGVYAPRYVCTRLREKGLTISSFVCDMSSGFACNIGYSLPVDWAFDQIKTTTLRSGAISLEVDNDYTSERDSSILSDPDNYTESSSPTLAVYEMISKVCKCYSVNPNLLGVEIEFDKEFSIITTQAASMSAVISQSATAPDAPFKISIPVTDGRISAPVFSESLDQITVEFSSIKDIVDLRELAVAIDTGTIQIEISETTFSGLAAIALEITSVATQTITNGLESVLSIGFKIVFFNNSDNYQNELQSVNLSTDLILTAVAAYQDMITIDLHASRKQPVIDDSSDRIGYALNAIMAVTLITSIVSCGLAVGYESDKLNLNDCISALQRLVKLATPYFLE